MASGGESLTRSLDAQGVCTLTLNRPRVRNALDGELIRRLAEALDDVRSRPGLRLLVLTGAGGCFSAGADLRWLTDADAGGPAGLARLLADLANLQLPTLALVNGPAYGGAVGLVAACDIALAADNARFAFPEVRLGLVPAVIGPYVLRAIGPREAGRWFLSGAELGADTARRIGLVHQVVPAAILGDAAEAEIGHLLAAGPEAQRAVKALLRPWRQAPAGGEAPHLLLERLRRSPEGREGVRAFLEKRKPQWPNG